MNIKIKYDDDHKKVKVSLNNEEEKDVDFSLLLLLTNRVIEEQLDLDVDLEGFDDIPDVGENYKKIFDDINQLKADAEILELKEKMNAEKES